MNEAMRGMISKDAEVILAFAECNMRYKPAAERLGVHNETLSRRLSSIYKRSKLDPRKFRDLVKLVQIIEGLNDVQEVQE